MGPIELIVAAVATGATAGASAVTSTALQDGYAAFRTRLLASLRGDRAAEEILARAEAQPSEDNLGLLHARLSSLHLAEEETLARAAEAVLRRIPSDRSGAQSVEVIKSQGVQIGNGGNQNNFFQGR